METKNIIAELKSLGLDPLGINIEKLDDDRVKTLLDALAAQGRNTEASEYLMAMNEAINRAEAPNFTPDFDATN